MLERTDSTEQARGPEAQAPNAEEKVGGNEQERTGSCWRIGGQVGVCIGPFCFCKGMKVSLCLFTKKKEPAQKESLNTR